MEKTNKTHLLKIGNSIVFGSSGVDYTLENGVIYIPETDRFSDDVKLTISTTMNLPEKLYTPNSDAKFMNKVITSFKNSPKTLGVLLAGEKGTGKTVMAKNIAKESGLPIITVDGSFRPHKLKALMSNLEDVSTCIIFDEFDKLGDDYNTDYMLQVFDGIMSSGKHLVLFTCNETEDVNSYMLDRCSRVRYYREFGEMSPSMVAEILKDRLDDKENVSEITDFIMDKFGLVSFDNVASFADEINAYPNDSYADLFKDMNISER